MYNFYDLTLLIYKNIYIALRALIVTTLSYKYILLKFTKTFHKLSTDISIDIVQYTIYIYVYVHIHNTYDNGKLMCT